MKIHDSFKQGAILRYSCAVIFTGIIYLTLPFARAMSNFLSGHDLLKITIYLSLFLFSFSGLIFIFRYIGFRPVNFVFILLFFLAYGYIVQTYDILVEKIHFVEYGILALLLYWALRSHVKSFLIYPLSLVIIFFIGWGDEGIQYLLPDRYYDLRDVILNALAGGLILVLIFIVETLKTRTPVLRQKR